MAAAAAAGVLIGLLFVTVSLRSETVFGDGASAAGRVQAGSAFISLSDCFCVSLVALIPQTGLGVVAVSVSIISLLVIGILLVISPRDQGQVYNLAYLEIALFAVALSRAWALVQGRHLRPSSHPETSRPAPPDTSLSALSASRTSTDQQGGGSCYQPPAAAAAQLPSQAS